MVLHLNSVIRENPRIRQSIGSPDLSQGADPSWSFLGRAKVSKPQHTRVHGISHLTHHSYSIFVVMPKDRRNDLIPNPNKLKWIKPMVSMLECVSTKGKPPGPPYEVTVEIGQFGPSWLAWIESTLCLKRINWNGSLHAFIKWMRNRPKAKHMKHHLSFSWMGPKDMVPPEHYNSVNTENNQEMMEWTAQI